MGVHKIWKADVSLNLDLAQWKAGSMIGLAFYFVQGTDIMLYYTQYFLDLSNTSMFILHYSYKGLLGNND